MTRAAQAHDLHPRNRRPVIGIPATSREIRDLVAGAAQAHGKIAHPTLGTSDGHGVQPIVDQADPHPYEARGTAGLRAVPKTAMSNG